LSAHIAADTTILTATYTGVLEAGDVLRPHTLGTAPSTAGFSGLSITATADANHVVRADQTVGEVSVYGYMGATQTITTGTYNAITDLTERKDTHDAFNSATGVFTAPVDGSYRFDFMPKWSGNTTGVRYIAAATGGVNYLISRDVAPPAASSSESGFAVLSLVKGATVELKAYHTVGSDLGLLGSADDTMFSIYKLSDDNGSRLYALPQSEQQDFGIRMDTTGSGTVLSQIGSWYNSWTRTNTGEIAFVLKSGMFTTPPIVTPKKEGTASGSDEACEIVSTVTTSGFTVRCYGSNNGTRVDSVFNLKLTKSGADASSGQVYVGTVARNQFVHFGSRAQNASSTVGDITLPLNYIEGDLSIASISSDQVIITAGRYTLEGVGNAYLTGTARLRLKNITDAADNVIIGVEIYNPLATARIPIHLNGEFTVSATTIFEIIANAATATTGGFGSSGIATCSVFKLTKIHD